MHSISSIAIIYILIDCLIRNSFFHWGKKNFHKGNNLIILFYIMLVYFPRKFAKILLIVNYFTSVLPVTSSDVYICPIFV